MIIITKINIFFLSSIVHEVGLHGTRNSRYLFVILCVQNLRSFVNRKHKYGTVQCVELTGHVDPGVGLHNVFLDLHHCLIFWQFICIYCSLYPEKIPPYPLEEKAA
jgi:hypothetical protein